MLSVYIDVFVVCSKFYLAFAFLFFSILKTVLVFTNSQLVCYKDLAQEISKFIVSFTAMRS